MGIIRELLKASIMEEFKGNNYNESFMNEIVEDITEPTEPAYVCSTPEELSSALREMSEI